MSIFPAKSAIVLRSASVSEEVSGILVAVAATSVNAGAVTAGGWVIAAGAAAIGESADAANSAGSVAPNTGISGSTGFKSNDKLMSAIVVLLYNSIYS
jgi:hypothetical protein